MKILPEHVAAYKRTPEFNEINVPSGLLTSHQTKERVWAKIIVHQGQLQYTINDRETEVIVLNKHHAGIVEPAVLHTVKPLGNVRFFIEYYH